MTTGTDFDSSVAGTYSVKYNVSDAAGNAAAEVTRTVTVEAAQSGPDTTAPVITLKGEAALTLNLGDAYADLGATAQDDTDGDISGDIVTTGTDFDSSVAGTYSVKYNVSDAADNAAAEVTRTVTVEAAEPVDPGAPTVTITSVEVDGKDVTVTIGQPATAYDHWHIQLDEPLEATGPAGGSIVLSGLSFTFEDVSTGAHTVYVGLADAAQALQGEPASQNFSVLNTSGPELSVTYGSAFSGNDGSIFTTSDGKGLDASVPGLLSFGYFNTGFDVAEAAGREDVQHLLGQYNLLHANSFDEAVSPGFLSPGGTVFENGVGAKPYLFLFSGITAAADIADAQQYGLFSDSSFANIVAGASPVPADFSITALSYDEVLLGTEVAGGGFGTANAYAAQSVEPKEPDTGGPTPDTNAPTITLLGQSRIELEVGEAYVEDGAKATDDTDGNLTADITITGDVDSDTPGTYLLKYNVSDAAGNAATEVIRTVIVLQPAGGDDLLVGEADSQPNLSADTTDDTDQDGLTDGQERYVHGTNPDVQDTDGDGLTDGAEVLVHGTSPRLKDSDDDGFSDGAEVTAGTDPKDGASAPEQLPAVRISSVQVDGATVTVTLLGLVGDTDHWHVSLDQPLALAGPAGGISVEDGLVHTFEAVPPGSHTIYAGPVGEDHALVGDAVSHTFNVLNTTGPVVSVTFGSDFAGEDGSIFTTSDGKGLDSTNAGLLAFGYFNTGFDVTAAAGLSDTSGLISQFNLLQSSSFDSVASPGFLTAGGTYVENGVDSRPYLFLLTGVTDFSKAESATEYGLSSPMLRWRHYPRAQSQYPVTTAFPASPTTRSCWVRKLSGVDLDRATPMQPPRLTGQARTWSRLKSRSWAREKRPSP